MQCFGTFCAQLWLGSVGRCSFLCLANAGCWRQALRRNPRRTISLIDNVLKLHSQEKLLHCDLKPDNVIWNGMDALILDFGHAQRIGEVSPVPGTYGFEAPEVKQGKVNTTSTDSFSFGRLLLKVLDRATEKCKTLHLVAEGLCMSDVRHRMSLQDALNKLITIQNDDRELELLSRKKSRILTMTCAEGGTLSPTNNSFFMTTQ